MQCSNPQRSVLVLLFGLPARSPPAVLCFGDGMILPPKLESGRRQIDALDLGSRKSRPFKGCMGPYAQTGTQSPTLRQCLELFKRLAELRPRCEKNCSARTQSSNANHHKIAFELTERAHLNSPTTSSFITRLFNLARVSNIISFLCVHLLLVACRLSRKETPPPPQPTCKKTR
uniref:Secreted protein n=1 Tax=Mycena chlorophos TaxID=658473 RepID=A0ABQ0LYN6_MYCCL|nr:predicted protein [Mycena chlorophos]